MGTTWNSLLHKLSEWATGGARLAFAATIVLMPLRARYELMARPAPPAYKDFTDFLLFESDISIFILLVLWCFSLVLVRRPVKLGSKFIWIFMLGLCLASVLSTFSSLDRALSLYHLSRLIILFLFYLYVVNEVRSPVMVVLSVAMQVILQSVFAVMQFLLQSSVGLQSFGEHILDPMVRGVSVVSDGKIRLLRAYGLAEHPNILGGCLAFSLILILAFYLYGDQRKQKSLMFVYLLGLAALLTTFSRSAWLALLAGSGMLIGIEVISHRRRHFRSLVCLGLIGILLFAPFVWKYKDFLGARFNLGDSFERIPTENQSIAGRRMLNETAIRLFLANPFVGVGLGASALAIGNYYSDFPGYAVPPHFALLAVSMETGVLGAASYVGLLICPWFVLAREKTSLIHRPYLTTACALLLAITFVGLFDIYPWLPPTGRLWHWLIWALWSVAYENGRNIEPLQEPKL